MPSTAFPQIGSRLCKGVPSENGKSTGHLAAKSASPFQLGPLMLADHWVMTTGNCCRCFKSFSSPHPLCPYRPTALLHCCPALGAWAEGIQGCRTTDARDWPCSHHPLWGPVQGGAPGTVVPCNANVPRACHCCVCPRWYTMSCLCRWRGVQVTMACCY